MSEVKMYSDQLEDLKKQAETHKKLVRLMGNQDFKELILEGFALHECARYVGISVNLSVPPENRENAANFAKCSALLVQWLELNIQLTQDAEHSIPEIEQALITARAEEAQYGVGE